MFEDFDELDTIVNNLLVKEKIYDILSACNTDSDIIKKIGSKIYSFLKFIILSNNFKLKLELVKQNKNNFIEKIEFGKDIICFEIIHDITKKEKFNVREPEFLFHGSNICNWYSIMRNGLKNCSGTTLMAHGAAYGNGIYFSDSAQLSNSYSRNNGDSDIRVMGIAQILNKNSYHKGGNVFVVPDEDKVLLKYLIVVPSKNNSINEFCSFITNREKEIKKSNDSMLNIVLKRLSRELTLIQNKYPIEIIQQNDKIIWNVVYKRNNFDINVNITFNSSFPHDPPFVMIRNPKIKVELNNNIFENGVIYLNNLTPKLWNPKTKMIDILNNIGNSINQLDIKYLNQQNYDYYEVLQNYDNLLKTNNMY